MLSSLVGDSRLLAYMHHKLSASADIIHSLPQVLLIGYTNERVLEEMQWLKDDIMAITSEFVPPVHAQIIPQARI